MKGKGGIIKEIHKLWLSFFILILFIIIFTVINESERLRISDEFKTLSKKEHILIDHKHNIFTGKIKRGD